MVKIFQIFQRYVLGVPKFEWPQNKLLPRSSLWLLIFQVSGKAGRFGLVKPGHPSKHSSICLVLGNTFKIIIDSAKKKIQTLLYSAMLRGSYGPPLI